MKIQDYFDLLAREVKKSYEIAGKAKAKGLDPVNEVEVPLANSLAERVVGLVSVLYAQVLNSGIVERILELEKEYGSLEPAVALKIAEEVARQKFCKFENDLQAIEAGIRVALGYSTLGYVSSPIEGFIQLKVKKTADGKDFLAPYYSGPIRSAGGTEAGFSLVVIDHLREVFGYSKYDPTEDEIKRGIHECYEYHERITNLQYLPSEQELEFLMRYLPVQLTGDPSEDIEVFNYKDLPRVETNNIRSGFCLVMGEGIAQKAPKILKRVVKLKQQGFPLSDWAFLEEFVNLQKKIKEGKKSGGSRGGATYMQDLVAGRPVFAHPSRSGAFRLRYGRARNTGYSTLALHPATMSVTDGFIAVGTQLKIEKPTKGCTVASCDSIMGPIVKLNDGSVLKLKEHESARKLYNKISEILYLGDILVPYGDFYNRNHLLDVAGFTEEEWVRLAEKKGLQVELHSDFKKSIEISQVNGLPLHPDFIFFWKEINKEEFIALLDWIAHARYENHLILPYTHVDKERFKQGKRALELIGCPHQTSIENVVLNESDSRSLLFNLGIKPEQGFEQEIEFCINKIKEQTSDDVLTIINSLSPLEIRDLSGTFIGARMGRPEKAKLRKLPGSPHMLFPVGNEGGRLKSLQAALEKGKITSEFPVYRCVKCNTDSIYPSCSNCLTANKQLYYCSQCEKANLEICEQHSKGEEFQKQSIDINAYFEQARKMMNLRAEEVPMVKGLDSTSSKGHACEHLAKGILRARHNLNVNKDGTIRYDMTEMPLTQFKPLEIGTSVEKLIELGYENDIHGKKLENDNQILELLPHDIILPSCPESPDQPADEVFLNVSQFLDDEFELIYGLPRFFKAEKKSDIVGNLMCCMSPHTSATVIGRLIGFSKIQALLASPYIHAAMRRDCDGDEAAVMFLMDLLLNFSRKFLPSHRGGTQDAPLVLNMRIRANEVDDMIFDVDIANQIPLSLYEFAHAHKHPSEIKMEQVKSRLGGDREFVNLGYTHENGSLNDGPLCSSYKTLPSMQEKVNGMMELCSKIRAVDTTDVSRLIIERHFIRDTRGNLRKFSQQGFRCVACNEKFRRVPLAGKCHKCGGKILFTISEGSILKYMQPALDLARTYKVQPYLLESLELTEMYIQSIFGKDKEKQESINKWF